MNELIFIDIGSILKRTTDVVHFFFFFFTKKRLDIRRKLNLSSFEFPRVDIAFICKLFAANWFLARADYILSFILVLKYFQFHDPLRQKEAWAIQDTLLFHLAQLIKTANYQKPL